MFIDEWKQIFKFSGGGREGHLYEELHRISEFHLPEAEPLEKRVPQWHGTFERATFEAMKKWTMLLRNWGKVYGELSIMYEGRIQKEAWAGG